MNISYEDFQKRMREIRKQCGLTQAEFAEKLFWSENKVKKIEANLQKLSVDDLIQLDSFFANEGYEFLADIICPEHCRIIDSLKLLKNDIDSILSASNKY